MNLFLTFLAVFFLIGIFSFLQTDDTDKDFFNRSGMYLYTDYKTGLQYLGGRGGIIPRLDEKGTHMKVSK